MDTITVNASGPWHRIDEDTRWLIAGVRDEDLAARIRSGQVKVGDQIATCVEDVEGNKHERSIDTIMDIKEIGSRVMLYLSASSGTLEA
ncbi:hypothetical protein SEA_CECE_162 [Microbacterium phage Cece]|nr:hypothetical protein SEA_CECE_162 [Microbacterium phage Cece]